MAHERDEIDDRILKILQGDNSVTNTTIASEVGISPGAVAQRISKLRNQKIIKSMTAVIDHEKVGLPVTSFIGVILKDQSRKTAESAMNYIEDCVENVLEIHEVFGDFHLLIKIRTKTLADVLKVAQLIGEKPDFIWATKSLLVGETKRETFQIKWR